MARRRRKFHQRHQGQGTRRGHGAREQAALFRLAHFRIIGSSANLSDRALVRGGVLPQIEARHVQSKSVDPLDRRSQFTLGQHRTTAGLEPSADHLQHLADRAHLEKSGAFDRFAGEAFLIDDFVETARHLSAQDREEKAIGLMRIALALLPHLLREIPVRFHEPPHFRRDRRAFIRHADRPRQLARLLQKFAQRQFPMQQQNLARDGGCDVRIAIAIAADPRSKSEPARRWPHFGIITLQRAPHVVLQTRQRIEECRIKIPKAGARFIGHLRPRHSAAIREPERNDLAFHLRRVRRFAVHVRRMALAQDLRHPP